MLFFSCQNTQEEKFRNIDIIKFHEIASASNITILDVRTSQERANGYINNSTHIDFYDDSFIDKVNLLNKENPIYIYCKVGGRSAKVSEKISELGFKDVYNLEGGFITWAGHNLPFEFNLENKSENLKQGFTKADIDSILSLKTKTLIYISTKWCAPCREMNPIVEKLKRAADTSKDGMDPEMVAAERIARQLHRESNGPKITSKSREKGNEICDHLIASLRNQPEQGTLGF